jgi:hypothetical protein
VASHDRRLALGLAVLALLYLAAGRRYPLDTLAAPGPGVFPLFAGAALLLVAASLFAATARTSALEPPGRADESRWSRPGLIIAAALVGYAALLPLAGFLAPAFALVVITARSLGLSGWWRPVALGAGTVVAVRLLFVSWLGVPLP